MDLLTLPTLESTTSGGERKFWRIRAFQTPDGAFTQTIAWRKLKSGEDSQLLFSVPSKVEPKNIGRSNETTPGEQAISEAKSEWAAKQDQGYWEQGREPTVVLTLPMLAHSFKDRKHKVTYPVAVQPKLDGIRMLTDGVKGWSRQSKLFIPDVIKHLMFDTGGLTLDGELMLDHDEFSFQQTTMSVKKYRTVDEEVPNNSSDPSEGVTIAPASHRLVYHVYDIVDPTKTFRERNQILINLALNFPPQVKLVYTGLAFKEGDVQTLHEGFCDEGYEGTMVRTLEGKYKIKDRSNDLLKNKDFLDAEYPIVDVVEGTAKHTGCAIFVCEASNWALQRNAESNCSAASPMV